ncbi:vacuolar-type h+-translocating inorganic pyrophosphatase, putative [Ichthyophthirius multifiliis]|uniref:H(+)-exporting diphosphatase n=1 Tax=Ichthyophthirius multifiliis TaxID=5932 RepID=G0R1F8_ICHMU|nr:vacuolar-type h+-translocating inorganic pyrophosphatase, putative [Ichthyophthirius multifiliis]EGR28715.1 vacuolar-type h+-translocating inorganic pyrophosphatase, putative [Ichthyophthirius multifiliis]|eukprot:XP_004029951.1 vacuolar-type h+-translocating inorganic pyrophosphatase, putative [Ichthyophthirius multifiliis]
MKRRTGSEEMQLMAKYIQEGSEGFFTAQYGTIFKLSFVFCIMIMLVYYFREPLVIKVGEKEILTISNLTMSIFSGISFCLGSLCSAFSGYAGMWVSVRANLRTCSSATKCYNETIKVAFYGGYFGAAINIAQAILGISSLFLMQYFYFKYTLPSSNSAQDIVGQIPLLLIGFGFGASFVAMFAQLGGGIYTKAADVGADIIGKIESDIPEDDHRNPAVIADLVGDNVGDCAGQAADLFESISAEILSAMILGATLAQEADFSMSQQASFMLFPLAVHCLDLIASTIGLFFVNTKAGLPEFDTNYGELEDPLVIMKRGYRVSMSVGIIGFIYLCYVFLNPERNNYAWINFSLCGMIGILVSYLFIEVTQYYTDYQYQPVRNIAQASKTGHATNVIAGLSVGLESTGLPIIIISIGLLGSYYLGDNSGIQNKKGDNIGGLFGTAISTMGMFCTGVYVLSMSGFGPIADNAGGIAELSQQPAEVRKITDKLDAVGNVTKANTKGYSVGSASLACFLLFSAFIDEVNLFSKTKITSVDITQPEIFIGGLIGSMCVFIFTSWTIAAVGNAAQDVIKEVRRQFKEHPEILHGEISPNYKQCVEIVARAGLREMVKPGLLAVFTPVIVGVLFKYIGIYQQKQLLGAKVMSSFLMFATSTGILMALFLNNAGGAWDNAKKYIESGELGGKGSETHKAAVTGDTVGDPCKDTAGPSIHILIKLFSTITLVLAPLFIE